VGDTRKTVSGKKSVSFKTLLNFQDLQPYPYPSDIFSGDEQK